MTNKLTIALEIHDPESPLLKQLMRSFTNDEVVHGVKIYAAAHDDLFDKMERIEKYVNHPDVGPDAWAISWIINEEGE